MNLKYYFKNLMKDRNGVDGLFYLFFVLYLLLSGFNFMYHSVLIYRINLLLLVLAVFRLISKNKVQRKKENDVFIRFLSFFLPKSSAMKRKIMESQTHAYHECQYCGTTLRFPRKRGKFNVTCPVCKHRLTIRNWF